MAIKHVAPAILPVVALFLLLQANILSAATPVVVVGSVFCDTCLDHEFSEASSYFIPGAVVAVECSINRRTATTVRVQGETDEYGEFTLEIPPAFRPLKRCRVRTVSSPEGECNIPSTATPKPLVLAQNSEGRRDGDGAYNAGSFSYRPLNVPAMCYRSRARRAALEEQLEEQPHGAAPLLPTIPNIPNIPTIQVPPLPFPLPPATSLPLPQLHVPPLPFPFPFPFPSAPPAKEDEPSKDNSNPPTTPGNFPPLPKVTVPPLPSMNPNPNPTPTFPSLPFPRPTPFPFQFPPIPFLSPPPPSADTKAP